MSLSTIRRTAVITTEIIALVAAALIGNVAWPARPASATVEQPVVAFHVLAPTGITVDSPWVIDASGLTAWALGVDASGAGVIARRDVATATITTTPNSTGWIGATDARLMPTTGNIAFLAKRQGTGGRLVIINPTTGARVSMYDLPATDTSPRGIGVPSNGASVIFGSNTAASTVMKVTASTGALVNSLAQPLSPTTSGVMYSTKFFSTVGTTTPKLVSYKDATQLQAEATSALNGVNFGLFDPVLLGSVAWYGTDVAPGHLVGVDLSTRLVTANYVLGATETGLRNITVAPGSTYVYGTTVKDGHTHLLAIRLSDGARLGDTDLGAFTGATSIALTGRFIDVTFPGSVALVRTTTAAPPSAPAEVTRVESDRALTVNWNPVVSAEPLVTYVVTVAGSPERCATQLTSCTITGLTNGTTYSVTVTAESYAGSTASSPVTGTPATLPDPPANVVLSRGDGSVTATWTPTSNGGRPITEYELTLEPGTHVCRTVDTTCTISGLTNGQEYAAHVIARTAWGDSAPAVSANTVRPASQPDQPMAPFATRANRSVTLSWDAPYDQGEPVTEYAVDLDGTEVCRTVATTCTVDSLTNGAPVSFTVRAMNAVGWSMTSTASFTVTPATTPTAPNLRSIVRGDGLLDVSWDSADDGGEPITAYQVTTDPASAGCVTLELSCSIAGLDNGQRYDVSVVAVNMLGPGEPGAIGSGTPATVPSAPTISGISDEIGAATVTWEPGSTGGDPIGFFRVILWRDAEIIGEWLTTDLTHHFTGIANPDVYRVTVEAENSVGTSARATGAVTPLAPPPPPVVEPPVVEPPIVEPPVVEPPIVDPPVVEPPTVQPPVVEPPVVQPPTPPTVPTSTAPSSPIRITMRTVTRTTYTLQWTAHPDGGSPITDYRVTRRVGETARFLTVSDGVSARRTVQIPRPTNGKAVYVRIVAVNSVGASTPAAVVKLQGKKVYAMPRVLAVRFSDAAAFAGLFAKSTPYDGTSFASVFDHSDFL